VNVQGLLRGPVTPARIAACLTVAALLAVVECRLTLARASDGWHVAVLAAVMVVAGLGRVPTGGSEGNDRVGHLWARWSLAGLVFFIAIDSADVWFGDGNASSAPHLLTRVAFAAIWALGVGWLAETVRRRRAAREDVRVTASTGD
jgi:hypothetical protein